MQPSECAVCRNELESGDRTLVWICSACFERSWLNSEAEVSLLALPAVARDSSPSSGRGSLGARSGRPG